MTHPGRKPVSEAQDNRQIVWDALKSEAAKSNARMTLTVLCSRTGVDRKTAGDYLVGLVAAGYVDRIEDEFLGCSTFLLVQDGGYHAPRLRKDGTPVTQGVGVTNMWRSMRILKTFTAPELAQISTTKTVSVSEATVVSYIGMLFSTGYLAVVEKARPSIGRKASYRLVRNSGPKPPMIQRVKRVYDPNTGLVHQKVERE